MEIDLKLNTGLLISP